MNLAEFSIKKKVITVSLTLVFLGVGLISFNNLARLEDPEFTIKEALIFTPYPGASAAEVEEEVSNVMELACQELGQLKRVESTSYRGLSVVKAFIKDEYDKNRLPQVWDELRRKVTDYQGKLPPGAGPSVVNDDYGDVFGVYLALTGEGYTFKELYDFAKLLRRELLLVQDVKKIIFFANQPEVVWIEMSRAKMAALDISLSDIYSALRAKNIPVDAGRLELGPEYIPINPTGEYISEQEFGDLMVKARGGDRLVFLKDVATIRRGYQDPPTNILRYDSRPAIGIGIATIMGGNVVTMGELVDQKLKDLETLTPLGMELHVISHQSQSVIEAIDSFVINLAEAIIIVVVILLIFMGLRSGLIIGFVLSLTISGSFLVMGYYDIMLERISLGALIIALGMLVDNAIVVIDGMKVRIEAGEDRLEAAKAVVGQTAMPLLGATAVAVMAFAAIGTSDDSTGEYCRSLFQVILISLSLSWVTAMTTTPLLGYWFLKGPSGDSKAKGNKPAADPYGGKFYAVYRKGLEAAISHRWLTVGVVVAAFFLALYGFGFVTNMFFPNSTRPQFFIECYLPEGMHIRDTEANLAKAEDYLRELDGVTNVITQLGGGDPRFLLTYVPGKSSSAFGVIMVSVEDYRFIDANMQTIQEDLEALLPSGIFNVRKFLLGPGEGGKIQLRISGPDPAELRRMARVVKDIMHADPGAKAIRDEWREKVKVVRPQLAESQARQLGIDRPQVASALQAAFSGKTAGVYREGEELLPIIARAPEDERVSVDNLQALQIWSPAAQRMIPMRQVVSGFATETEDATLWRRNRTTTIRIHCDPKTELASKLFARIKPKIEQALNVDLSVITGKTYDSDEEMWQGVSASTIKVVDSDQLPLKGRPDYFVAWGGEAEDSARAIGYIAGSLPMFAGLMILIVVFLFNAVRQPLVIWLTVPLALIGVSAGLLLFRQPFGFMALLGLLSLSGMMIKNAIVLIDQIDTDIGAGKGPYQSVVDAGVSRMRPVAMAALTTILGMLPLLQDAFFIAMAVTIMMGLLVATVLTLIIVPVLYAMLFKIPSPAKDV